MRSRTANRFLAAAMASATMLAAAPATAQVFTGDTTGSPTFNRPIQNGELAPTALSGTGTAVPYDTLSFTVSVSGTYTLSLQSAAPFDNYLGLYSVSFDPNAPLTNVLIYDDDDGGVGGDALINALLTSGLTYTAVITGFDNNDFGAYSLTFSGQGIATPVGDVPEPATWAMMLIGFGAIGASIRYRRAKGVQTA
jgi:hypothetical protein